MSNIRDLQKLKVTRKVHEFAQINMKVINPDITSYNYDSITTKVSQQQHKNNNNSENRVAISLELIQKYQKLGFEIFIENK